MVACANCLRGYVLFLVACDILCRRANSDMTYSAMLPSSDFNCSSSVLPLVPFLSCWISWRILCRIFLASLEVHTLLAYWKPGACGYGATMIGSDSACQGKHNAQCLGNPSTDTRYSMTYCQNISAVGCESILSGMLGSKQRALRVSRKVVR